MGTVLLLKNKSKLFINRFIFGLLLSAFVLHFSKLLFEPYFSELPQSIRKITFENICAVSTLVFPWFYLSKKKILLDYMVVIGMLSGLAALVVPTEALGKPPFTFDVLRFYYSHIVIFLSPFLMVVTKIYQFNYRRIFLVPLMFYVILLIILINEIILMQIGYVESDLNSLLDPNYRNSSFIFGPTMYFQNVKWILTMWVPKIFLTGPNAGQVLYWPIIWLIIPAYIYISLFGFIIGLIFSYQHIKQDVLHLIYKLRSN